MTTANHLRALLDRVEGVNHLNATVELLKASIAWANWCAGEGIMAIESEGVAAPEDFLMAYSNATGEEDWETLPERLTNVLRAALLRAKIAQEGQDA